jgi:hypothetical protein
MSVRLNQLDGHARKLIRVDKGLVSVVGIEHVILEERNALLPKIFYVAPDVRRLDRNVIEPLAPVL